MIDLRLRVHDYCSPDGQIHDCLDRPAELRDILDFLGWEGCPWTHNKTEVAEGQCALCILNRVPPKSAFPHVADVIREQLPAIMPEIDVHKLLYIAFTTMLAETVLVEYFRNERAQKEEGINVRS